MQAFLSVGDKSSPSAVTTEPTVQALNEYDEVSTLDLPATEPVQEAEQDQAQLQSEEIKPPTLLQPPLTPVETEIQNEEATAPQSPVPTPPAVDSRATTPINNQTESHAQDPELKSLPPSWKPGGMAIDSFEPESIARLNRDRAPTEPGTKARQIVIIDDLHLIIDGSEVGFRTPKGQPTAMLKLLNTILAVSYTGRLSISPQEITDIVDDARLQPNSPLFYQAVERLVQRNLIDKYDTGLGLPRFVEVTDKRLAPSLVPHAPVSREPAFAQAVIPLAVIQPLAHNPAVQNGRVESSRRAPVVLAEPDPRLEIKTSYGLTIKSNPKGGHDLYFNGELLSATTSAATHVLRLVMENGTLSPEDLFRGLNAQRGDPSWLRKQVKTIVDTYQELGLTEQLPPALVALIKSQQGWASSFLALNVR